MFGAIAWGALGGTQLDHENTKSVHMQRGTLFYFLVTVRGSNMDSMRASKTCIKPMR